MPLIIEGAFGRVPVESVKQLSSNEMAIVALTIQSFMGVMFEEIKKAGFVSVEFLEKAELFLRAVTPSYPRNEFDTLLDVFIQIDENFSKTKFFYGLNALRQLCTHESQEAKILLDEVGVTLSDYTKVNSSLIIFASHLVENIIKFIQSVRKTKGIEDMSIDELRFKIDSQFQGCLLNTVSEVNMTLTKLNV